MGPSGEHLYLHLLSRIRKFKINLGIHLSGRMFAHCVPSLSSIPKTTKQKRLEFSYFIICSIPHSIQPSY